jgi:thioredoxin-related protein
MKLFFSFLLPLLSLSGFAADHSPLIEENDFQQLSQQMKEKSRGLLLMFHAEHCPYCARMEKEILTPMVISGEYDDRIFIRKLQIDEARNIKNFEGKTVEPSDISDKYQVRLTPTLVFLDYKGQEKAKKMVGINTVELFGAYLDAEIDQLMKNLLVDVNKSGQKVTDKKMAQSN